MVWLSKFIWWCFKEYSRLEPARESRRYFRSVPTIWQVSLCQACIGEKKSVYEGTNAVPRQGKPAWARLKALSHAYSFGLQGPHDPCETAVFRVNMRVKVLKAANVCRERSGTPGRVLHLGLTDGATWQGVLQLRWPVSMGKIIEEKHFGSWDILGRFLAPHVWWSIPPIWVWVNTYTYHFSGMNIHLPAILMSTRGTRFWPIPIHILILAMVYYCFNHINQVLITINH